MLLAFCVLMLTGTLVTESPYCDESVIIGIHPPLFVKTWVLEKAKSSKTLEKSFKNLNFTLLWALSKLIRALVGSFYPQPHLSLLHTKNVA